MSGPLEGKEYDRVIRCYEKVRQEKAKEGILPDFNKIYLYANPSPTRKCNNSKEAINETIRLVRSFKLPKE